MGGVRIAAWSGLIVWVRPEIARVSVLSPSMHERPYIEFVVGMYGETV